MTKFTVYYDKVFTKGTLKDTQITTYLNAPDYSHLKKYLQKLNFEAGTQKIMQDLTGNEYFICNVKAVIEE
jgi:uncharacterized membrane protein YheB (UPF0754 family)